MQGACMHGSDAFVWAADGKPVGWADSGLGSHLCSQRQQNNMSLSLCLVWIDAAALAIDNFDFPCIFLAARTSRLTMPVHETEQDECQFNALGV